MVGSAYVVATGAAPHIPDLPGLGTVEWLTSTTAMEQQDLPASTVVVGGGYVGLEQAQLWAHLGVEVAQQQGVDAADGPNCGETASGQGLHAHGDASATLPWSEFPLDVGPRSAAPAGLVEIYFG